MESRGGRSADEESVATRTQRQERTGREACSEKESEAVSERITQTLN